MRQLLWTCFLVLHHSTTYANPHLDGRIIGGTPANIIEFPYQISLQNDDGHFCGGSVIHRTYILTAAHCLEDEVIKLIKIRAGSHFNDKGGVVISVCAAEIHKNYNDDNDDYDYDIAILTLCEDLVFNKTIRPVALPKSNELVKDDTTAVVSGWGTITEGEDSYPSRLRKLSIVTYNQGLCREKYKNEGPITGRMLCARCRKDGACDTCQGDSGGPLVANGKLIGIVSWGKGCAEKDYPGVYTRVSKFRKWIKNRAGLDRADTGESPAGPPRNRKNSALLMSSLVLSILLQQYLVPFLV